MAAYAPTPPNQVTRIIIELQNNEMTTFINYILSILTPTIEVTKIYYVSDI